jgi:acyl carrier protein
VKELSSRDEFEAGMRSLLAELLVLKEDEIHASSLLFDDLDADSVAFIELAYRLREDFGIVMPEVKSDEETLNMPIEQGISRLRDLGGDQTLFEYVETRVLEHLGTSADRTEAGRARLLHDVTAGLLSRSLGGRLPDDIAESTPFGRLRLVDTFRFLTFGVIVDYVWMLGVGAKSAEGSQAHA